ncbi:Man1-Src1 protein [Gracilaria domingensis]|nr:Man1-Src1 protein [Gracilaria domingensis]
MFDRFVEHLANFAARNLSELAGRAECGEDIQTKVVYEDLGNYIVEYFYEMRNSDPSFFRVGLEDIQNLESAMHQAIGSLSEDEHGVVMDIDRRFYSTRPAISLKCKLRRKVMDYLYEVVTGIVVCLLLLLIRVKIYLVRRHQRQREAAHQRALEVLRDQVVAFRHNEEDVAFVSDVMLREEVLGRPTKQVIKLWKDVEESLKSDARVLRKHQTIRGMPSYTFEYVGIRRSSGSGFGSFSRRSSSFGSRASLDSLDLRADDDFDVTPRRGLGSYVMRFLDGR